MTKKEFTDKLELLILEASNSEVTAAEVVEILDDWCSRIEIDNLSQRQTSVE